MDTYSGKILDKFLQSGFMQLGRLSNFESFKRACILQTVVSIRNRICINSLYSIPSAEGFQLKNELLPVPVTNSNRAEVNKADIPVSGQDSADSKNTDRGTSSQPNPFRKVKGMGAHS